MRPLRKSSSAASQPFQGVTVFSVTARFVPSEQSFDEASAIVDGIA
jgi:hypothetical protein